MIGWLFRSWYLDPPHPPHRTPRFLPNNGRNKQAPRVAVLWDGEMYLDADPDYLDKGLREGWIVETYDRHWVIRNNKQTLAVVYSLCLPE